jgi:hypothetical protein
MPAGTPFPHVISASRALPEPDRGQATLEITSDDALGPITLPPEPELHPAIASWSGRTTCTTLLFGDAKDTLSKLLRARGPHRLTLCEQPTRACDPAPRRSLAGR